MNFEKVRILDWLKTAAEVPLDLTASGMSSLENLSELGLKVDDLPISGDNFYGYKPLREYLARAYKTVPERITIGAGASICNFAAMSVLYQRTGWVTIESPAYEPFITLTKAVTQTSPERIFRNPENNYRINPDDLLFRDGRPRIMLMANPHNPTGLYESPGTIGKIAKQIESDNGWMIIDEVFMPFLENGDQISCSQLNKRIVSTCSLTKAWGLWSLRIGWIIGQEDVIYDIERTFDNLLVVQPFITEFIAYHVLHETDIGKNLLQAARDISRKHLEIVTGYLDQLPEVTYITPDCGISILVRFKDSRNTDEFCENLESEYGVRVINGSYFEIQDGFRMSFGVDEETLRKGMEAISQAIRNS